MSNVHTCNVQVLNIVESLTGIEEISPDDPLMDAGIDSLTVTSLVDMLKDSFGLQLSPTLIFEHSTSAAVAEHIVQLLGGKGDKPALFAGFANSEAATLSIDGFAGRWPGGASSIRKLQSLSSCGRDAVGSVPARRWEVDSRSLYGRTSGFMGSMQSAEMFDAPRFAVSPAEVVAMDPQQRLLLEVGYEALATHEVLRDGDRDSGCGIFLGITNADFQVMSAGSDSVYTATGGTISIAAGRTSFTLGLQGPCVSIDTACSSAIVALHDAGQGIRANDCNVALTTAVSLYFAPHVSIAYARAGMLSADGRCKTFDASANGYVRGEGIGALVMSGAVDAKAQPGLCSSAVRQDGKSASLTAPSGAAQVGLLSLVIARAGAEAAMLSSVESHGTGTPLGDPIEVRALEHVNPSVITLGAIKANVGHLEPAAGIIGLASLMNTLHARYVMPCAKLRIVNPHMLLNVSAHLRLVPSHSPLPDSDSDVAGISSFGYSGTIAHAIVLGATEPQPHSSPIIGFKRKAFMCKFLPQQPAQPTPAVQQDVALVQQEVVLLEGEQSAFE
eukprot:3500341-Prymnesium_polylepis.1